jgi:hypothetical protein
VYFLGNSLYKIYGMAPERLQRPRHQVNTLTGYPNGERLTLGGLPVRETPLDKHV